MRHGDKDLALLKDLLVARSGVQRLQVRAEIGAMRSRSMRLPLLSLFLLVAGRARAGSWLGKAAAVVAIARTVGTAIGLLKR